FLSFNPENYRALCHGFLFLAAHENAQLIKSGREVAQAHFAADERPFFIMVEQAGCERDSVGLRDFLVALPDFGLHGQFLRLGGLWRVWIKSKQVDETLIGCIELYALYVA